MKTVRLGNQLEARLEEIARLTGRPVSEIIREAVKKHCDELTVDRLDKRLSDVVGAVSSGGARSRQTGRDFTELVRKKHRSRRGRQP